MSDEHRAQQARPHEEVIAEVMDPCRSKSEHEWYAAREIDRLRDEVERLKEWQKDTILDLDRARRLLDRATAKLNSGVLITDEQIDAAWRNATDGGACLEDLGIVECPECEGVGVGVSEHCTNCAGHGWIREERGDD